MLYVTAAPSCPLFWCANDLLWNLLADVYGCAASAALPPGAEEQQEWKAAFRLSPLTHISWRKATYSCASSRRLLLCKVLQGLILSLFLFIMCWRAVEKVMRSQGLRYHQSVDGNQLVCLFSADAIHAMTQMSQNLYEISLQIKISWLNLTKEGRVVAGRMRTCGEGSEWILLSFWANAM